MLGGRTLLSRESVRRLLVLSLSLVFLLYVYQGASRLRRQQLGVSVSRQPRRTFAFPTVMLCASATSIEGEDTFVVYALAKFTYKNGNKRFFLFDRAKACHVDHADDPFSFLPTARAKTSLPKGTTS